MKINFLLLWLCVLNELVEGNKERDLTEFEEKAEYTNRIQGIHSKRLLKRILTNPSNSLVPYGSSFGDKIVPYGDDVSFGPVKLKDDLILNGKFYNGLFINTNGFISFEHSDMFEPVDLSLIENPLVAVLFNDFDTKRSGSIFYKEVINTDTLDLISSALESDLNSTQGGISLTSAFVVTWINVPLYGEENLNSKNTFQLVLATEANCSSYSIFYYSQIDLDSMTNFTIGITSGDDGLFIKQKDQIEFLNSIQDASNLPLKYSFKLSENESSCLRNDKYDMYPYGLSNGDSRLPKADDISFGPILLNKEISFYENNYSSIYISTNGYVSFEFNDIFEPVAMNLIDKPTIAVLFDDFDTKRRGNVFYRQSQNKRLLESISNDVNELINEKPELESSMIVTWDQIPTYGSENLDTKNTFQLVLGSTVDKTLFGLLIYKNISLGTQTNFSIGLTNGEQIYSDIEIEGLMEKINNNLVKKAFKLKFMPSTTSSSSPEPTTDESTTTVTTDQSKSIETSTLMETTSIISSIETSSETTPLTISITDTPISSTLTETEATSTSNQSQTSIETPTTSDIAEISNSTEASGISTSVETSTSSSAENAITTITETSTSFETTPESQSTSLIEETSTLAETTEMPTETERISTTLETTTSEITTSTEISAISSTIEASTETIPTSTIETSTSTESVEMPTSSETSTLAETSSSSTETSTETGGTNTETTTSATSEITSSTEAQTSIATTETLTSTETTTLIETSTTSINSETSTSTETIPTSTSSESTLATSTSEISSSTSPSETSILTETSTLVESTNSTSEIETTTSATSEITSSTEAQTSIASTETSASTEISTLIETSALVSSTETSTSSIETPTESATISTNAETTTSIVETSASTETSAETQSTSLSSETSTLAETTSLTTEIPTETGTTTIETSTIATSEINSSTEAQTSIANTDTSTETIPTSTSSETTLVTTTSEISTSASTESVVMSTSIETSTEKIQSTSFSSETSTLAETTSSTTETTTSVTSEITSSTETQTSIASIETSTSTETMPITSTNTISIEASSSSLIETSESSTTTQTIPTSTNSETSLATSTSEIATSTSISETSTTKITSTETSSSTIHSTETSTSSTVTSTVETTLTSTTSTSTTALKGYNESCSIIISDNCDSKLRLTCQAVNGINKCLCPSNSFWDTSATPPTCNLKKSYSSSCADLEGECDSSLGLSCLGSTGSKTCQCNIYHTWNATSNKCACPSGWLTSPTNQCYFKSMVSTNWDAAELDCISKNAHIISINTQAEFDYFNSIRLTGAGIVTWIGLRAYSPLLFSWIDGTSNFLNNWSANQPDNGGGSRLNSSTLYEDRGHIYGLNNFFNDIPEASKIYYVCELNMCNSTQYYDTSVTPSICKNRKKLNQSCSDIAFECDSNLVCFGTTGSKTCSLDLNSYGLINYWPIQNNMDDYAGGSHMIFGANNFFSSDRFNNSDSALNFANGFNIVPSGVYFSGDFTVTLWINYNQMVDWSRILEFSNSKSDVVSLYASWSNLATPGLNIINGSSNSINTTFSSALDTNKWYHVAFRFCATSAKIYVDGVLKASAGNQLVPNNVTRTTNYIGGNSFGDGKLNAKIDELRIYKRCVSQNEIMNLMSYSNTSPDLCNSTQYLDTSVSPAACKTKKTYSASCNDISGECNNALGLICNGTAGSKTCSCQSFQYIWDTSASIPFCNIMLTYSERCSDSSVCNVLAGLSCLGTVGSKTCQCNTDYVWNSALNKCSCPAGWLTGPSNQCYYKSTTLTNWDAAELDCISKNAHSVSINTQAEYDYLYSIINTDALTWVGLRAYSPLKFSWIDGTTNLINWKTGQPDNGGGTSSTLFEDRGMIYGPNILYGKFFNDIPEASTIYYVCELNMCNSTQYFDTSVMPSICKNRKKFNQPCSDIAFECDSNLVCFGTNGSKTCSLDLNSYGLINYWPITNSMNDSVGTSHMIYGANNTLCPDRFNNTNSAINFVNGYNSFPAGVYFNGGFTVALWINYNQMVNWARILEVSNLKSDVVSVFGSWESTGSPGLEISIGSKNWLDTSFSGALLTGKWYHLAFTLCSTIAKIYVDGVLKVSGPQLTPTGVTRTTNYVGGNSFGNASLNARLDELRLYNRCISQNEIMNLINA